MSFRTKFRALQWLLSLSLLVSPLSISTAAMALKRVPDMHVVGAIVALNAVKETGIKIANFGLATVRTHPKKTAALSLATLILTLQTPKGRALLTIIQKKLTSLYQNNHEEIMNSAVIVMGLYVLLPELFISELPNATPNQLLLDTVEMRIKLLMNAMISPLSRIRNQATELFNEMRESGNDIVNQAAQWPWFSESIYLSPIQKRLLIRLLKQLIPNQAESIMDNYAQEEKIDQIWTEFINNRWNRITTVFMVCNYILRKRNNALRTSIEMDLISPHPNFDDIHARILKYGINRHIKKYGNFLNFALSRCKYQTAQWLIDHGADINIENDNGHNVLTALMIAAGIDNKTPEKSQKIDAIFKAVMKQEPNIRYSGADIKNQVLMGASVASLAASSDQLDIIIQRVLGYLQAHYAERFILPHWKPHIDSSELFPPAEPPLDLHILDEHDLMWISQILPKILRSRLQDHLIKSLNPDREEVTLPQPIINHICSFISPDITEKKSD